MKNQHTPAPWKKETDTDTIVGRDNQPIALLRLANSRAEKQANTELIAAAPDMLELLQMLVAREPLQHGGSKPKFERSHVATVAKRLIAEIERLD